jgi:hypothetical protein
MEDYVSRRRSFMLALNATNPTPRERLDCMRKWMEANSPYSPEEKLANLMRAFKDEGIL